MSDEEKAGEVRDIEKDVEEGIELTAPVDGSQKKMNVASSPLKRDDSKAMPGKSLSKMSSLRVEGSSNSTIVWRNLNKFVDAPDGTKKQILFDINGSAKPGEMIALMGPSGSGKTTLLNVLGGRALANLEGKVTINNVKYKKSMRRTIAYVLQEDLFHMQLTVRQQLYFTACLRLPESMSNEEKNDAVNLVIDTLRIQRCADTQIMLISGGEKKRTNIGTELLTNPSILLLDEPTSGLDATAANSLVVTLRELAMENMTIVTSIHQPSSKVFYSFDKLILLADGCMVYTGPPGKCLQYLATKNYIPPADYNPADFVMDLVNETTGEDGSEESKSARAILIESWDNAPLLEDIKCVEEGCDHQPAAADTDSDDDAVTEGKKYQASYITQFWTLLQRSMIVSKTALVTSWQLIQCVSFAIICGLAYFRMPNREDRIDDRAGYIFLFLTFWFFMTLFQGMMQFIPERAILQKERSSGSFRLSAYFLAKITAETPIKLFLPFLFLAISYPMANLNPDPGAFFGIVGIQLLAALAGESVGLWIGTVTVDMEKAMVLATLMSLLLMLAGGYFVQNLPSFAEWVRYISPFKYSYDACVQLEFDRDINCDNGEYLTECLTKDKVSGDEAIDLLDVTESVWLNCLLLIVYTSGFRLMAYLCLRFLPHNSGRV